MKCFQDCDIQGIKIQVAQRARIAHLRAKNFLNSSQVSKIFFFLIGQRQLTPQSMVGPFLTSIKGRNSVANLPKK